mgnify:CR=1 FL=1|jgi:hypothetical protein
MSPKWNLVVFLEILYHLRTEAIISKKDVPVYICD